MIIFYHIKYCSFLLTGGVKSHGPTADPPGFCGSGREGEKEKAGHGRAVERKGIRGLSHLPCSLSFFSLDLALSLALGGSGERSGLREEGSEGREGGGATQVHA